MGVSKKIASVQVAAFLENRARKSNFDDAPIFYGELVARFGLPLITEAWSLHPLCDIFEELDVEDAKRGRPFRTVLVVSQEHSIPGPGFFKMVARLCPQHPQLKTDLDKMRFFNAELKKLLKHYGTAG